MSDEKKLDNETVKQLAINSNGEAWGLLAKTDRTPLENAKMLSAAMASLYLWDQVGTDLHRARGHWLISRVFCELKQPVLAIKHSELCGFFTGAAKDRTDFDLAYAIESLARANAGMGNHEKARELEVEARKAGLLIKDEQNKELFLADLKAEPWFGALGNSSNGATNH